MNDELINELRSSDVKPTFSESPQHLHSGSRIFIFITKYRRQKKNVHQSYLHKNITTHLKTENPKLQHRQARS